MISENVIKELAAKIDKMVDWVKITGKPLMGNALEIADNYFLTWGLSYLNQQYGNKLPQQYLPNIEQAIMCFVKDDFTGVVSAIPEGIDQAIDIKFFDDDFEAVFIATNFNAIIKAIQHYAVKKTKV